MNTDNLHIVKNNEMKNPLSNEFLKNYYLDPTSHGFSPEDNSTITGFDLIHGQCPETSIFIASKLLDRGYDVKVEKTIEKQSKGPVLHDYLGELVFDLVDQLFMTDGFIDVCEDAINKFINGNNISI